MDGERRTTPDGTSFAWQHWSHTFEYALAAGPGDWRSAGFPAAGQDYNHDLLAVATSLHTGSLPASLQLAAVEPAGAFLSALKPRGNPLAPAAQPDPADGLTVRLRDLGGTGAAAARFRLFTGVAAAAAGSLCEDADGGPLPVADSVAQVAVPQAGLVTFTVHPGASASASPGPGAAGPADGTARDNTGLDNTGLDNTGLDNTGLDNTGQSGLARPEPAQPVYARYWLHGKGPAPAGNMPVAVHLSPAVVTLDGEQPGTLRLTVACGPAGAAGAVRLDAPDEIVLSPAGPLSYDLGPRGHCSFDLAVAAKPGTPAGRRFATARITDSAGQVIEDSALLATGQPPLPRLDVALADVIRMQQEADAALAAEADVTMVTREVSARPGEAAGIDVLVRNNAASAIRGEAQLLSPYGSWRQAGPWTTGFALKAGTEQTLRFTVSIPPAARPGEQWWALVKVMYFGRLRYTSRPW